MAPLTAIPEIDSAAVPVLVTVTDWAELEVPISWEPKDRLDELSCTDGETPVPESDTLSGLSPALSVTFTVAVRLPVAVGAKLTEMVQLAPAPRLAGHVLVWVKSPGLVPLRAMLLIARAVLPVFVRVTPCAALVVPTSCEPKLSLDGARLTAGASGTPLPDRLTLCGLPVALSATCTEAVRVPAAVGLKVTEIVQLAFTASVAGEWGQLSVSPKSELLAPDTEMPVIDRGAVPELVKVTVWAPLVLPTS